jgi:hypothetical protein
MYRLGEREHHHRKLYIALVLLAVIIVALGLAARHYLKSDSQITQQSPAVTSAVSFDQTKTQRLDMPYFTMNIPASWKLSSINAEDPKPKYIWQGTIGEDKNRWISVYVDTSLANFAVNRAVHIQSDGPSITVIGSTSDNCISYTGASKSQAMTPAKWEGIDFICDSGNYERDVVGTVSSDGMNNINMTGPTKGVHRYFFTYTDNSHQPDYSFFSEALKSFKAK